MTLPLRGPPGIQTNQNKIATELELSVHGDWQTESYFELLWSVLWHTGSQPSESKRFHPAVMPDLIILKEARSKSRRQQRCLLFLGDSIVMAPRQINAWLGKSLSAIIKGTSWEMARVLLVEVKILQNWHLVSFSPTRLDLTPLLMS